MIEKARVLRVEGDRVTLACDDSACGSCPASQVFCSPRTREFTAENASNVPVAPNQMVDVYIHPGKAVWAGFTVLMMPLVLFALGYFLGDALIGDGIAGRGRDVLNVLVGLGGLGVGFGLAFVYHRSRRGKDMPQVVGISSVQPALQAAGRPGHNRAAGA
ncbi:MAG: SoxR reducing system RseC family protein [Spirochaetota bacterium]